MLLNLQMKCALKCLKVLYCLRPSLRERILINSYRQTEKEVHVTYVLQQIRIFKALLKKSTSRAVWKDTVAKHKYLDGTRDLSLGLESNYASEDIVQN